MKVGTQARGNSLSATVYYRFRIDGLGFDVRRVAFPLCVVTTICGLAATLDQDVSLERISTLASTAERRQNIP